MNNFEQLVSAGARVPNEGVATGAYPALGLGRKATVDGVSVQKQGKVLANYVCRADANYAEGELGPAFFEKSGSAKPVWISRSPTRFSKRPPAPGKHTLVK